MSHVNAIFFTNIIILLCLTYKIKDGSRSCNAVYCRNLYRSGVFIGRRTRAFFPRQAFLAARFPVVFYLFSAERVFSSSRKKTRGISENRSVAIRKMRSGGLYGLACAFLFPLRGNACGIGRAHSRHLSVFLDRGTSARTVFSQKGHEGDFSTQSLAGAAAVGVRLSECKKSFFFLCLAAGGRRFFRRDHLRGNERPARRARAHGRRQRNETHRAARIFIRRRHCGKRRLRSREYLQ